ncbi:MAG TPA: hypothetical protein VHC90_04085 [Bryobacteraceae bacterium]|nr:hypothetical protein [Bryobacteraceae bacterium]
MPGMNCREFERPLMDRARSRPMDAALRTALSAHLEVCAQCSAEMERQIRLTAAMEALADRTADLAAPPSVEHAILAELSMVNAGARRRWIYAGLGGAIAASLAIAWRLTSTPTPVKIEAHVAPVPVPAVMQASAPVQSAPVSVETPLVRKRRAKAAPKPEAPFIAIPYTPPLDPRDRIDVVRMDVPVAALIAAGLPVGTADPTSQVRTDVLVGQDGRARAVRLVALASSH